MRLITRSDALGVPPTHTEVTRHDLGGQEMTTYDVGSRPLGEPTALDRHELAAARRDSAPIRGILFGLAIVVPIWVGAGFGVAALLSL